MPRPVVGHHRKIKLSQAVDHSTADTWDIDDRPYPVVLRGFLIDVPHGFGNVTDRGHRVGFVVRAIVSTCQPEPGLKMVAK